MAVPTAVLPSPSRIPALPPYASLLRVSFIKGGGRKVQRFVSGEERRNVPKPGFLGERRDVRERGELRRSGDPRVQRLEDKLRPLVHLRSSDCLPRMSSQVEKQRLLSHFRSRSGVTRNSSVVEEQRPLTHSRSRSVLPRRSYAEVAAQPMSKVGSEIGLVVTRENQVVQNGFKDGQPAVCFSSQEVKTGLEKFRFALVLKFHRRRPPAKELHYLISSKWGVQGRFSFSELWDSRHVIIILESEVDMQKGLRCKIRKVGSCGFKLFRWSIGYDPLKASKSFRKWIRLPDIPLFLYDKAFADVIVSSFASILKLDVDSDLCRNLSYMRLCIKLKEGVVIPERVWIQLPNNLSYWQSVEVEGPICPLISEDAERPGANTKECDNKDRNSGSGKGQGGPDNHKTPVQDGEEWQKIPFHVSPNGGEGNKCSNSKMINADGDGLEEDGTRLVATSIAPHGQRQSNEEKQATTKVINDDGDVTTPAAPSDILNGRLVVLTGQMNSAGDGTKSHSVSTAECNDSMGGSLSIVDGSRKKEKVTCASEWQTVSYARKKRLSSSKKELVPAGTSGIDMCTAAGLKEKEFIVDGPISLSKEQEDKSLRADKAENVSSCQSHVIVEERSMQTAHKLIPRDFSQAELNMRKKVAATGQPFPQPPKASDGQNVLNNHTATIGKDQIPPRKGASRRSSATFQELVEYMQANPHHLEPFNNLQRKAGFPILRGDTFEFEYAHP